MRGFLSNLKSGAQEALQSRVPEYRSRSSLFDKKEREQRWGNNTGYAADGERASQSQSSRQEFLAFNASPFAQLHYPRSEPGIISVAATELLGEVRSTTTDVNRDLGFSGQIGSNVLLTYGDTLYMNKNESDQFHGIVSNSVAFATHNPLSVIDFNLNKDGYPHQACPVMQDYNEDNSTHAVGITNVVATSDEQGILYFLLNYRPGGGDQIKGAGIATVSLVGSVASPHAVINRLGQYWWDGELEPWYGDVSAISTNGYIYAYGHAKDSAWIYLTRVKQDQALQFYSYEYWNGATWQKERLCTKDLTDKEAVFWQIQQGQVIWSEYYQCYLFIYCDKWWNSKILAKRAQKPEGPWSTHFELYQGKPKQKDGCCYSPVPHPYFDRSGKTLVVTWTNLGVSIEALRVTFQ